MIETRQGFWRGKNLTDSSSQRAKDEGWAEDASKLFEKEWNSSSSSGSQQALASHHQTHCPPVPRRGECCHQRRPHSSMAPLSTLQIGHGQCHPLSWKVLPLYNGPRFCRQLSFAPLGIKNPPPQAYRVLEVALLQTGPQTLGNKARLLIFSPCLTTKTPLLEKAYATLTSPPSCS